VQIAAEVQLLKGRHCSWCLELTDHSLYEMSSISRVVYSCGSCACKTLQCRSCVSGMCRNYPGLSLPSWACLACKEQLPWASLRAYMQLRREHEICVSKVSEARSLGPTAHALTISCLKAVLTLDTVEKRRAKQAGMLRPFLALVAMGIDERVRVSNLLEVPVLVRGYRTLIDGRGLSGPVPVPAEKRSFDADALAHAEAWMLISQNFTGIQSRSNEFYQLYNATWDETLAGVCTTVFSVSRKAPPAAACAHTLRGCCVWGGEVAFTRGVRRASSLMQQALHAARTRLTLAARR
jgi:hypothetical protein